MPVVIHRRSLIMDHGSVYSTATAIFLSKKRVPVPLVVPEDEEADAEIAEGEESKNLSGTVMGEIDSCLIAGDRAEEGMAGEFVSDDTGVGRILLALFRTGVVTTA